MGEKTITDIFYESYYLDNVDLLHTYSFLETTIDVDSYLLLRLETRAEIYWLWSSNQVILPIQYINIFASLDRFEGDVIKEMKPVSDTDRFLLAGCGLVDCIWKNRKNGNQVMSKLLKAKASEFRKWMKEQFGVVLPSIRVENINEKILL